MRNGRGRMRCGQEEMREKEREKERDSKRKLVSDPSSSLPFNPRSPSVAFLALLEPDFAAFELAVSGTNYNGLSCAPTAVEGDAQSLSAHRL